MDQEDPLGLELSPLFLSYSLITILKEMSIVILASFDLALRNK